MPTPLQVTAVQNHSNGGATDTVTMTGVLAGSTLIVVVPAFRNSTPNAALVSGVSSSNGGALTLALSRLRNSDNGGGQHRLGQHVFFLPNAAAGAHTLTVTFSNATANYSDWFAFELSGISPASPHDATASASAAIAYGPSIASVTSNGLAQQQNFILAVAAGVGASSWNGSTTAPMPAPSGGYASLRGKAYTSFNGVPFQASWLDTASVAPVSASWTIPNDSIDDGTIAMLVVFKLSSGGNYIEILVTPDIEDGVTVNASTGWTVHVAAGDPKDGYMVYSGVTAQAAGNEIRVSGAAGAVAVGGTVNVQVVNASLGYTSGWGVGTVRASA